MSAQRITMNFNLLISAIFGLFALTYGCTELTAVEGVIDSIDSHDGYPEEDHGDNIEECWIIHVDAGLAVKAWTVTFHLEQHYDYMYLTCGEDGEYGIIGEYTGRHGVTDAVYTNGSAMLVDFFTDQNTNRDGFRLNYTAVNITEANGGNCLDWEEWRETWEPGTGILFHEHHHYHASSSKRLSEGAIAGIVIGVFVLVIILAAIGACVVCFVCSLKTRNSRLVDIQNQQHAYPMSGVTPPAYAVSGATAPQDNERKVHPNQLQAEQNAFQNPVSPPPTYEPSGY